MERKAKEKESFFARVRPYVPGVSIVFFIFGGLALIVHMISYASTSFADFMNLRVSAVFRSVFAKLTGILPISLAEIIVVGIPVWVALLIVVIVRASAHRRATLRVLSFLISVIAFLYGMFVFLYACGYRGSSLEDKLGLSTDEGFTAQQLYETALWLNSEVQNLEGQIGVEVSDRGSTVMPYSFSEMNSRLCDAYASLSEEYPFIQSMRTRVKPILLSHPLSYTHMTGFYTFFTGEANVCTSYPDYSTVYTTAHEMAHQRGIASENEANFVAFLALVRSEDPYLRYCGYFNLLEYVNNSLYRADYTLFCRLNDAYSEGMRAEMNGYNQTYEQYGDTVISDIVQSANDKFLQSQGTPGRVSYGMVSDLAVAYYLSMQDD